MTHDFTRSSRSSIFSRPRILTPEEIEKDTIDFLAQAIECSNTALEGSGRTVSAGNGVDVSLNRSGTELVVQVRRLIW